MKEIKTSLQYNKKKTHLINYLLTDLASEMFGNISQSLIIFVLGCDYISQLLV